MNAEMRVKREKMTYKRALRGINAKILWHYCHLVTLLYYSYLLLEDDRMIYIYVKCIIRRVLIEFPIERTHNIMSFLSFGHPACILGMGSGV